MYTGQIESYNRVWCDINIIDLSTIMVYSEHLLTGSI